MGFLIFLLIVAGIIFLVVLKNKRKKEKEIEELKNSDVYALAIKIKEELEKKMGYCFGGPHFHLISHAYGYFFGESQKRIDIVFTEYPSALEQKEIMAMGKPGIKNDVVLVYEYSGESQFSDEVSQELPEFIKIAAEVMNNSGYGKCSLIKKIQHTD